MLRPFQIIICSLQNYPLKLLAHFNSLQSDQHRWGNFKVMGRMIKKCFSLFIAICPASQAHFHCYYSITAEGNSRGWTRTRAVKCIFTICSYNTYCCYISAPT